MDGHCGYHVLFETQGDRTAAISARMDYLLYLLEQAPLDFPHLPGSTWQQARARVFRDGSDSALEPVEPAQWLSNEDLPWLAQMLQVIICVCDLNNASGWATYLPITITASSLRVVGMAYTPGHWQSCELAGDLLPPVLQCVWSWDPASRSSALSSPAHLALHKRFTFTTWRHALPGEGDKCGCDFAPSHGASGAPISLE